LGIRVAAWATPHIEEWHRKRHLNRTEGERHLKARNWSEAEQHLAAALGERRHSKKNHSDLLLGLAAAQRGQGKLSDAEQTTRLAAGLGGDHVTQMRTLDALMDVHLAQENYAAAQETAESILSKESGRGKPDKARLATSSRKLGTALAKAGRDVEAVTALDRAAKLFEEALGSEHLETAAALSEAGALYRLQGKHLEAQSRLRRAVEIQRAAYADSNEATQCLSNLAASLMESGDAAGACGEYERVLTLKERQLGVKPEETAEAQINLARIYLQAGRSPGARELLLRAVGALERKGGERYVAALELLAEAEQQAGRKSEAARLREKLAKLVAQASKPADLAASPAVGAAPVVS
jgi:hypothetical protein